jgi:hypothetical protein
MALFGGTRDINLFGTVNRELIDDIVSQQVGYYKFKLGDTQPNVYGESLKKYYIGPVLLNCLIVRGDTASVQVEYGRDFTRPMAFRFFREHLVEANIVPELADIVMYNEAYYEVDNVNENQYIVGKDNSYAYSEGLENFGSSLSIILDAHYVSPDALGITQIR